MKKDNVRVCEWSGQGKTRQDKARRGEGKYQDGLPELCFLLHSLYNIDPFSTGTRFDRWFWVWSDDFIDIKKGLQKS